MQSLSLELCGSQPGAELLQTAAPLWFLLDDAEPPGGFAAAPPVHLPLLLHAAQHRIAILGVGQHGAAVLGAGRGRL